MAISKEQWQNIESELSGSFGVVKLSIDGKEICLTKQMIKENQLAVVVYIDGKINPIWGDQKHEQFLPLVKSVWRQRAISVYSPKDQKEIIKVWGKRRAKKEFPRLEEKIIYFDCYFPRFGPLQRQYKKLVGLELISIGYVPLP